MTTSIRPYVPADRAACLRLLRTNVPEHFLAADEQLLAGFLDALPGPYFVVVDGPVEVACGGIAGDPDGATASLCWGLVDAARHRQGIGALLLHHRLAAWGRLHPGTARVRLHTTQKVRAFYERHGFTASDVQPDGYGPGLDRVTMARPW